MSDEFVWPAIGTSVYRRSGVDRQSGIVTGSAPAMVTVELSSGEIRHIPRRAFIRDWAESGTLSD